MLGGWSNPTTPKTLCHQDGGCDTTLAQDKYSSWRLPVPAAAEDAVVLIERQSICLAG
jgi:hypothetical protein